MARLGDSAAALDNLKVARRTLATITDAATKSRLEAEITFREGSVLASTRSSEAIPLLTGALAGFEKLNLNDRRPDVLQARGSAQLHAGNDDAAFADFVAGVAALEERQRTLTDEALRASALDPAWPLFTDLIRMELKRSRWLEALAYAERAKSQSLGAPMPGCATPRRCRCCDPGRRRRRDRRVLHRARRSPGHLGADAFRRAARDVAISAARLRNLVDQYRSALANPAAARRVNEIAGELYAHVIRPISAMAA